MITGERRLSPPPAVAIVHHSKNRSADVRFGSKADIRGRLGNVRFTPKSGHRKTAAVASPALPLRASPVRFDSLTHSAPRGRYYLILHRFLAHFREKVRPEKRDGFWVSRMLGGGVHKTIG